MDNSSRRDFMKSAGAAATPPAAASAAPQKPEKKTYRRSGFAPSGQPRRITENLFVFEDTAKVYIVRDGSSAVLVDFGSGKVLDHLPALGISKVDWILHTHHHRDQCQGDAKAVERGIPIAVPAHERHLFEDAENFWRNRRVFHLYYVRNDFFTLTHNVPVAGVLRDYDTFRWEPYELLIFPTPGHTLGSVSLVGKIDGKKVAFSGDLIHSPG